MANILRSKFRGCLLGALFGDAFGALFEFNFWDRPVQSEALDKLSTDDLLKRQRTGYLLKYTDDTAMTKAMCRSLLFKKSFDMNDLAKGFVTEYFSEKFRGYGGAVVTVFERLHTGEYEDDVTVPAREQFEGTGSYGNGAAMRVSPIALFYHNDFEKVIKDSKNSALITHSHILGVHGAILQAVAVYEALNTVPGTLDVSQFIDKLINTAKTLETEHFGQSDAYGHTENGEENNEDNVDQRCSYVTQFQHIKAMLLDSKEPPNLEKVIQTLGHGVKAIEAVPAAIFSFLHNSKTNLKEVIFYAITLGGDTDTIASMAGAIAGAYWGDENIPEEWFGATESVNEVKESANQLYDLRATDKAL